MTKSLFKLLFFSLLTTALFGQQDTTINHSYDMLKQAENSFCNGDTSKTIEILEKYIEKSPQSRTTILISKKLSEFYIAKDKKKEAIALLTKALEVEPINDQPIYNKLYRGLDPNSVEADICLSLSKMLASLGDNLGALKYIHLADTKYLPTYGGCANGMIMYKTKLSLDFADQYLLMGDTTKAIDRLMAFFLSDEHYNKEVTAKLKSILLFSYSQKQIKKEINNGIKRMKIVEMQEDESENTLLMTFFGRTIKKRSCKSLKFNKDIYRKHKNILTLILN